MCEILGISFNEPVRPNISLKGFRQKSKRNPDGWGFAYFPDKSVQVFKEPLEADKSFLSEFIRNYQEIYSEIFVMHVRKSSVGNISHKNTHPFVRELNGREYVFAHNGSMYDFNKLNIGRFKPVGETDSEFAFCYILNEIESRNISCWNDEHFMWLSSRLKEINDYGTFNCIFSDGEFLFCFNDVNEFKDFCFVKREAPFETIRLLDDELEVELFLEKRPTQYGYIMATNPLTNEAWESFLPGELKIFKKGKIVFSNLDNVL
ncbi:MAG: putative glutamine amidotransferase YafJ [Ignavibacteria bacterium]|nr:putative glutamine amidotransferase YafJ [Ignavibacteria bacterium]